MYFERDKEIYRQINEPTIFKSSPLEKICISIAAFRFFNCLVRLY